MAVSLYNNKMNRISWSIKYSTMVTIGVAVLLIEACKKDMNPCEIPRQGETYLLSDSAKNYINHYSDANRIIFKNMLGADVAFEVATKDTIASYQVPLPCEVDTFQNQTVIGTSQFLWVSLSNSAVLAAPIFINLVEYPILQNRDAYETLVVSLGELFSNSFGSGDELFYYISGNNPQVNYLDSLTVGGKTFYAVYEMDNSGIVPKLEIKYTVNQGIIYIKDTQNSVEYVYDRKE